MRIMGLWRTPGALPLRKCRAKRPTSALAHSHRLPVLVFRPVPMSVRPVFLIRGLRVASALPLGDLPQVAGDPDVVIRMGPASALAVRPPRPGLFERRPGHVFLGTVGGGVVLVRQGGEIILDSRPGLDRQALLTLALTDGIDALLRQRSDRALSSCTPVPAALLGRRSQRFILEELL